MSLCRVLLLGGTGRLGGAVRRAAGESLRFAVAAPPRAELDLDRVADSALASRVASGLYDVVLNCAAAANVDGCDRDPTHARRLNADVPGLLARSCAAADLPFVHISTDYVFGGPAAPEGPFDERHPVGPAQFYGRTKADGERAVLASPGRRTVARVSWLFGPEAAPFADYVLAQARAHGQVPVFDQASRPTWLPGLGAWLLELCAAMVGGAFTPDILHPAGGPAATRAEWARAVLDAHGLADVPTVEQSPGEGWAPRPRDSRLATERTDAWMRATWAQPIPDWREMIGERAG